MVNDVQIKCEMVISFGFVRARETVLQRYSPGYPWIRVIFVVLLSLLSEGL